MPLCSSLPLLALCLAYLESSLGKGCLTIPIVQWALLPHGLSHGTGDQITECLSLGDETKVIGKKAGSRSPASCVPRCLPDGSVPAQPCSALLCSTLLWSRVWGLGTRLLISALGPHGVKSPLP